MKYEISYVICVSWLITCINLLIHVRKEIDKVFYVMTLKLLNAKSRHFSTLGASISNQKSLISQVEV